MKIMITSLFASLLVLMMITSCSDDTAENLNTESTVTRIEAPVDTEIDMNMFATVEETSLDELPSVIVVEETTMLASTPEVLPMEENYYTVTDHERDMIARVVFLESGICSFECQLHTASVIFNRLDDGRWGDSISDVIYYKNAFSTAPYLYHSNTIPTDSVYEAVDYVIQYGPTLPTYVRYFRASYDFDWPGYKNYTAIDNVYFGYLEGWENGAW